MNNAQNAQVNALLVIVSLLAVFGGLAIVLVTSPQSLQLSQYNFLPARATQAATPTASPTASETPVPPSATLPAAATHGAASATPTVIVATRTPLISSTPSRTPTVSIILLTSAALPPDVRGLAVVNPRVGTQTVRIRDLPNGPKLVAAVGAGTLLQVLFGEISVDGVVWVQVRLSSFRTGWIALNLITFTFQRPPGTGTVGSPPTSQIAASDTPIPTQGQTNNTAAPPPGPTAVPTRTRTPQPGSTNTNTPNPIPTVATATRTATSFVPTATSTATQPIPPTATASNTNPPPPSATNTLPPPSATNTPVPTVTTAPTDTNTPEPTVTTPPPPPTDTNTPDPTATTGP